MAAFVVACRQQSRHPSISGGAWRGIVAEHGPAHLDKVPENQGATGAKHAKSPGFVGREFLLGRIENDKSLQRRNAFPKTKMCSREDTSLFFSLFIFFQDLRLAIYRGRNSHPPFS